MYRIMASYKGGTPECVDECDDEREANRLVGEYRMAYGPDFRVWVERVALHLVASSTHKRRGGSFTERTSLI